MAFSASQFAEDTDLERFVLDRLGTHRVRLDVPGSIHDVRGATGHITIRIGSVVSGTSLRDELQQSLRPLGFGAAYKILDMLIEHVLRANGASAGRLAFAMKVRALAMRPNTLPTPLDAQPALWLRLAALYVAFAEARHAVTHRRAQATVTGDLEVYDNARRLTDTIPSAEIEAFAAAVHTVAELVIDATDDRRRASIAAWSLNALGVRHGLAALAATDPNAARRLLVMNLESLEDGHLRFDTSLARQTIDGQAPSLWDLRLHAGDRSFVGHWEDAPAGLTDDFAFHPASPPPWLSEEVPAE